MSATTHPKHPQKHGMIEEEKHHSIKSNEASNKQDKIHPLPLNNVTVIGDADYSAGKYILANVTRRVADETAVDEINNYLAVYVAKIFALITSSMILTYIAINNYTMQYTLYWLIVYMIYFGILIADIICTRYGRYYVTLQLVRLSIALSSTFVSIAGQDQFASIFLALLCCVESILIFVSIWTVSTIPINFKYFVERAISPYDGIEKEIITNIIDIGYNNPQNFINEPTIMVLGKIAIKRYGIYENIKKCDNN
eukprot:UN02964